MGITIYRLKLSFDDLYVFIQDLATKWRPKGELQLIIEDTGFGSGLIYKFKREGKLYVIPCRPTEAKEVRVQKHMDIFSSQQIFLLEDAHWKSDFLNELLSFPNGKHDDQVDALLQIIEHINTRTVATADIV